MRFFYLLCSRAVSTIPTGNFQLLHIPVKNYFQSVIILICASLRLPIFGIRPVLTESIIMFFLEHISSFDEKSPLWHNMHLSSIILSVASPGGTAHVSLLYDASFVVLQPATISISTDSEMNCSFFILSPFFLYIE